MLTRRGRFATEGPDRDRQRASGVVVAVLAAVVLATAASASASAGAHQTAPRMLFNHRISVATVCFAVTNPAGSQSMLYGLRYTDNRGRVDPSTPAIVANWTRPSYSSSAASRYGKTSTIPRTSLAPSAISPT